MAKDRIYTLYLSTLLSKLEHLEGCVQELKSDYSVSHLEKLNKALHNFSQEMDLFGDAESSHLLQQFEIDILVKIKNFYYNSDKTWLIPIEELIKKLRKNIEQITGNNPMNNKKRKIVLVDDDEDILKLLVYEFQELGFEVQTFKLGKEALSFLTNVENRKDVFLLILDRVLPDMDGLDILRKLSTNTKMTIPTLFLSVLSTENDILSGLQVGAVDYITKPFSVFFLVQKALNLLKST